MLPREIFYIILECDYDLLCQSPYPLLPRHYTIELLFHCASRDYNTLFNTIVKSKYLDITIADYENLFEHAVLHNSLYCIQMLVGFIIDPELLSSYIVYSIQENYLDIVFFLLKQSCIDIEYNNYEIIQEAITCGNNDVVQLVLDHPSIEDPIECSIVIRSIESRNKTIMKTIFNHEKVDLHINDNEPLRVATEYDDEWAINQILQDPWVVKTLNSYNSYF